MHFFFEEFIPSFFKGEYIITYLIKLVFQFGKIRSSHIFLHLIDLCSEKMHPYVDKTRTVGYLDETHMQHRLIFLTFSHFTFTNISFLLSLIYCQYNYEHD